MQVIGTLEEYTLNFNENSSKIVLNIYSNDVNTLEKLRGLKINVELKQFRERDLKLNVELKQIKKKRENIYKQIDINSLKASNFSINNGCTKLLQSIGGTGINALTGFDTTIYVYTIPKNNLEKSLNIFSEQLFNCVFRRFSTELQAVYEEYIKCNEEAYEVCNKEFFSDLCKGHPYSVPIIGEPEHLRNPSIKAIKEFYNKYYCVNNCTLLLVGDIDYDEAVNIIEKYFGKLKKKEVPKDNFKEIKLPEKNKELNILTESYNCGYLFFPIKIKDINERYKFNVLARILNEYLKNLVSENKVNNVECYAYSLRDLYLINIFYEPLNRQSLQKAKDLILKKLNDFCAGKDNLYCFNSIKNQFLYSKRNDEDKGNITDTILELTRLYNFETIENSEILSDNFFNNLDKKDFEKYVKDILSKPYYVVNKNQGNRNYEKLDKINISNMNLNNDKKSEYFKYIENIKSEDIKPVLLDFNKLVKKHEYNDNIKFYYVKKYDKKLFKINIKFNCGYLHDKYVKYLNYFIQFSKSKYKGKNITFIKFMENIKELGSMIYIDIQSKNTYISIFGISENLDKTINLFSEYINNITFDKNCVNNGIKTYLNNEPSYRFYKIKYKNYKDYIIDKTEIKQFNEKKLKDLCNKILSAKCDVLFSTDIEPKDFIDKIINSKLLNKCKNDYQYKKFEFKDYNKTKIYIHNISGAQNIKCYFFNFLNKLNINDEPMMIVYKEYYYNLYNDLIREKKGLTYSQSFNLGLYNKNFNKDVLQIYFETQPNKFVDAFLETLKLNDFIKNEKQFKTSYNRILNIYNCERFTDLEILNYYFTDQEYSVDVSKTNSVKLFGENIKNITLDKMIEFHNKNIKNTERAIYIEGNLEDIDVVMLSKYGEVKNLK